jgi:hypothetical protein
VNSPAERSRSRRWARYGVLVACGGCAAFVPDPRTAKDRARDAEPRCRGVAPSSANELLAPENIDSVEPAYAYVSGGPNGREARMRGARIHVRPLAGLSRESLARALLCHEVRVLLGTELPREVEPYTLEGTWLSIDVESDGDAFVVAVQTDDLPSAQRVLARARAFAGARPSDVNGSGAHPEPPSTAPVSPAASSPPVSAPASTGPASTAGQAAPLQ